MGNFPSTIAMLMKCITFLSISEHAVKIEVTYLYSYITVACITIPTNMWSSNWTVMNSTNFFVALYLSLNTFCVSVLNFNVNTKTQSKVWVRIRVSFSPHFCSEDHGMVPWLHLHSQWHWEPVYRSCISAEIVKEE